MFYGKVIARVPSRTQLSNLGPLHLFEIDYILMFLRFATDEIK